MNDIIEAIILGIVQGLTEFLPVSSSGHLELAKYFLNDDALAEESLLMTVTLHAATALATIIFFRKDILEIIKGLFSGKKEDLHFSLKIILSMIPAVLVGVLLEEQIESLFNQKIVLVGAMLLITGVLLFLADRAKNTNKKVTFSSAIIIGISQAIAILPGISRSGATISTSVLLGIDRERAARFSFLMVVPLIFGKMAKDLLDGEFVMSNDQAIPLIVGFFAALIFGYFACKWMIALVKNSNLKYFAYYCFVIGIFAMIKAGFF